MFTYSFTVNNTQTFTNFTLLKNGETFKLNVERFSVNATSLTFGNVTRNDTGMYTIIVTTIAGSDSVSFSLDVYCELMEK